MNVPCYREQNARNIKFPRELWRMLRFSRTSSFDRTGIIIQKCSWRYKPLIVKNSINCLTYWFGMCNPRIFQDSRWSGRRKNRDQFKDFSYHIFFNCDEELAPCIIIASLFFHLHSTLIRSNIYEVISQVKIILIEYNGETSLYYVTYSNNLCLVCNLYNNFYNYVTLRFILNALFPFPIVFCACAIP